MEKFENVALSVTKTELLEIALQIGAWNFKTVARVSFSCGLKTLLERSIRNQWHHDGDEISLTSNTNPEWLVIVSCFLNLSGIVWTPGRYLICFFQSDTSVFRSHRLSGDETQDLLLEMYIWILKHVY